MWAIAPDQIREYLQALVQINSVNPGLVAGATGEAKIAQWLTSVCQRLGLEVESQLTAPDRPNIIARWRGTGSGKSLLLTGHTDTVSVENMPDNPFEARIEDGRLYGRGAYDMKGGLAAILGAVAALRAGNFQPSGDIWLGFVTDEEYLSIGTEALVKHILPDAAILTEPTGMQICIAHKGYAWITLTTYGRAAHGSLYTEGIDAITQMGRLLHEITQMEQQNTPLHPLLGRPSVHASSIYGGLGLSTYPDQCTLKIEHRLLPNQTAQQALDQWQQIIAQHSADDPDFKATARLDFARPGYEIDPQAPIVQTLNDAFSGVMGSDPSFMGMWAWLDSAILGNANIPTVIFGPGGEGAHAAVEYVNLNDVYQCAEVLAAAVSRWTGAESF